MDETIRRYFQGLESNDKTVQYEAYNQIMKAIDKKVDWAYDVWGQLVDDLDDANNHRRSRAAQFLAGLAKSDPEKRILTAFPDVWKVTHDVKFVTARHSLQSIWKIGLSGDEQKELVMQHLIDRFKNCEDEKNYTLIRFDIIESLKKLYDALEEEEIKQTAMELIELEDQNKYRKKYLSVWK